MNEEAYFLPFNRITINNGIISPDSTTYVLSNERITALYEYEHISPLKTFTITSKTYTIIREKKTNYTGLEIFSALSIPLLVLFIILAKIVSL